jgi:hypothetical protein
MLDTTVICNPVFKNPINPVNPFHPHSDENYPDAWRINPFLHLPQGKESHVAAAFWPVIQFSFYRAARRGPCAPRPNENGMPISGPEQAT